MLYTLYYTLYITYDIQIDSQSHPTQIHTRYRRTVLSIPVVLSTCNLVYIVRNFSSGLRPAALFRTVLNTVSGLTV